MNPSNNKTVFPGSDQNDDDLRAATADDEQIVIHKKIDPKKIGIMLAVVAFAALGFLSFTALRAAGSGSGVEAEDGQLASQITACDDDENASGGSYVVIDGDCFGGDDPTPTPEPTTSTEPTATPDPAGLTEPVNIVAFGDSITGQTESWIYPLQDSLIADSCAQGTDYDFIGYEREFPIGDDGLTFAERLPGSSYDLERISRGGFNARGIVNLVKEKGFGGTPDVGITYLSVNNQFNGYVDGTYNPPGDGNPETMKADLKELVELMRAENPSVFVILIKLQNGFGNDAIDSLASEMNTAASPVVAADQPNVGGNTKDGIHPNEAGAAIIADKAYEHLKPFLDENNICG